MVVVRKSLYSESRRILGCEFYLSSTPSSNLRSRSNIVLTSLSRPYDLRVRKVEHVDAVDGEDNVADLEAARLGRRVRLYGGDHDGSRPVDPETEFASHALNADGLIAL